MISAATATPGRTNKPLELLVEELVSRGTVRVPPYPSTALKLQSVLATDYTVAALVEAMRPDPVFTGNLLRLANSPLYRRDAEVTNLASAVTRVGARELTRLAMASSVGQAANAAGTLQPLRRRAWREALAAALVCEALAPAHGVDPGEAFVAGLLHDVGKLLVLSTLEEALPRAAPASQETFVALVEAHHLRLGALLATRWQLPAVLVEVLTAHHTPQPEAGLLGLVQRADAVVALLDAGPFPTVEEVEVATRTRVDADTVLRLLPQIPHFIAALEAPKVLHKPQLAASVAEGSVVEIQGEACELLAETADGLTVRCPRGVEAEALLDVRLDGLQLWVVASEWTDTVVQLRPWCAPLWPQKRRAEV